MRLLLLTLWHHVRYSDNNWQVNVTSSFHSTVRSVWMDLVELEEHRLGYVVCSGLITLNFSEHHTCLLITLKKIKIYNFWWYNVASNNGCLCGLVVPGAEAPPLPRECLGSISRAGTLDSGYHPSKVGEMSSNWLTVGDSCWKLRM